MEKTDAELSQEFLEEYRKLVMKYHRDFQIPIPVIVKVNFIEPPPAPPTAPSIPINPLPKNEQ